MPLVFITILVESIEEAESLLEDFPEDVPFSVAVFEEGASVTVQ